VSHAVGELIEWLGRAAGGAEALGGKGASLDTLGRLGFRVPPGFCLTTAAFRTQLAATVDTAALAATGAADIDALAAGLTSVPLADEVSRPLSTAIDDLIVTVGQAGFEPRFAVRSSAIGEDGSAASYAGLHETELDVAPADIPGAVRRCWASLWSPAAIAYRRRRDLSAADAGMAVVVQALVPAAASAVVFTRHPVTGRDDQLVLTAVRGLGDAMVSGTVTPDTYVVDRATRAVAAFEPGEDPDGPALEPAVLAELVELSYAVEAKFGRAVDIEAAFAGGRWYLLQARPITTGSPSPARA
jgi:phosphoenolpyruvate synthase/pyruvate phosphate dikinase